ncbi:hypothetical protein NNO_0582 [Hydrogenimonas sp.]|nr:hypothetical protein NNO_0582 [Hydrogenimonas sp.]
MAAKVAIVGGGVSGVTSALILGRLGVDVTLFEKSRSLVSGPPFCHLHAGGNLYREISDGQCLKLLEQSIDFARFYPYVVDYRPTVIATPQSDPYDPKDLIPRLQKLRKEYEKIVENDPESAVLGPPEHYFRLYEKSDLLKLASLEAPKTPSGADEWMIAAAKEVDLETLKFPLILVQEYGLNLFRLSAGATLALSALPNVHLKTSARVKELKRGPDGWRVEWEESGRSLCGSFDYLVNAAGFKTADLDATAGIYSRRLIEFKAAYVTKWSTPLQWPEIIFHGERGTPRGMGQFTPYPGGYFQLHGMTKEITLFEEGLAKPENPLTPPKLPEEFQKKIEEGWEWSEVERRTEAAIRHIARFIPSFESAETASVPLFGAQQIPGDDPALRVAEVEFPAPRYARCEIVKVSSSLDMAEAIVQDMQREKLLGSILPSIAFPHINIPHERALQTLASRLAEERGYPVDVSRRSRFEPL